MKADRRRHSVPPRSSTVQRQADRIGQELRSPSRHRHRECAIAQRTAAAHWRPYGGVGAANCHFRSAPGYLKLPGALEPVFAAMLASATRICEAEFGNLFLRERETFR